MDLPCTRRVEPVRQSPRTEMYGYFTHGTVPPPRPYSSGLASSSRRSPPAAFPDPFRSPLARSRDFRRAFRYFAAVRLLARASLAISLALIGPLTPVPPEDSTSPPEVTHCSSLPCRPQTPWCGGWMRTPSPL